MFFFINHPSGEREENKTKIKQFGQELKKLCRIAVMVATAAIHGHDCHARRIPVRPYGRIRTEVRGARLSIYYLYTILY